MIKTALTKVLTVKAAAVLAAVLAGGGVALAASTGALPNPFGQGPSGVGASAHATTDANGPLHAQGSPSPSLVGLCHAYVAGAGSNHGKALENPAFTALINAAGGKDNVDAYCAGVLASARPSAEPSHPDGSNHPTGAPTDHPTGAPTEHPTGAPTSHGAGG